MNRFITVLLISSGLTVLSACTQNSNEKLTVNNCDNVFVVSDNHNIFLFEHESDNVDFHLLKKHTNSWNTDAFFDCKRNIIVSPYSAKGEGGITIFNLSNNKSTDYIIDDDVNGQLGLYKSGVLLSTKLRHHTKIDKNSGYVSPWSIINKYRILKNPENYPEEMVNDYKKGEFWKRFTYTHLFDLDTKKIVKSYKQTPYFGQVINGKIYAGFHDFIGTMDLENGFVEKIIGWEKTYNQDGTHISMPTMPVRVFVDKKPYIIPSHKSWDFKDRSGQQKLKKFKTNIIYQAENGKLVEVVTLPFDDAAYAVAVQYDMFVFNRSAKNIAKFNTQTNKLTEYNLALPAVTEEYYINSVGFTKDNFILSFSDEDRTKGLIFITNKNFTEISPAYKVPMNRMGVATSQGIQSRTLFN